MRRLSTTLVFLLAALAVSAAPVPKETGAEMLKRVYGTVTDPDSKVTCEPVGADGLRITLEKGVTTPQGMLSAGKNVPLVSREVDGDFVLTARVTQKHDLKAESGGGSEAAASAGLMVHGAPGSGVCFVSRLFGTGDDVKSELGVGFRSRTQEGYTGGAGTGVSLAKPIYLRLTRKDDRFTAESSTDGDKWVVLDTLALGALGAVRVGPVAAQSTNGDYSATFDHYTITQPTDAKK